MDQSLQYLGPNRVTHKKLGVALFCPELCMKHKKTCFNTEISVVHTLPHTRIKIRTRT